MTTPSMPRLQSDQTDFDQIAHAYDDSLPAHVVDHYLAKRLAYIERHAIPGPGPVLDLGCGTGLFAERVRASGRTVIATDPFRGILHHLHRRTPEIPAVQASGEALPFPDNAFALAYCIAVMHHIAEPGAVRRTLLEMARVTRPGGHVLIWDHNPRNPYWPYLMKRVPQDTGAERLIPEQELLDGLRAGGLVPVRTDQLGLVPDFVPTALLPHAAAAESIIERLPLIRRLCAHNVILALKP
ncbi:MAG: class I SAM-dependent methyltransferase [Thermomicrobiales bacterium]